jgi:hypothetical protein
VALGIPNACVVSPGLMQRFGVKALPFSVEIKGQPLGLHERPALGR